MGAVSSRVQSEPLLLLSWRLRVSAQQSSSSRVEVVWDQRLERVRRGATLLQQQLLLQLLTAKALALQQMARQVQVLTAADHPLGVVVGAAAAAARHRH